MGTRPVKFSGASGVAASVTSIVTFAVASTGLDVLLTAISESAVGTSACTAARLSPDQARAIGRALIEAAGFIEVGG
jgi:hypothetical protein